MLLHEFITAHRADILRRCRAKVEARTTPPGADPETDDGVPAFLLQLVTALHLGVDASPEIGATARQYGRELLRQGFTVSQVVHAYGDVCQAIAELAMDRDAAISTDDFRVLNRCLDDAIAGAVTEYGRERHQSSLESETARGSEALGYFAHELRNLINTALMAFDVLRTGNVGVAGSTGAVLLRSLTGLRVLVGRSLAEVRLTQAVQHMEPLIVSDFIEELLPAANLEANARGVTLRVTPMAPDVVIEADRQVLAAVVGNLLNNAFKFTKARTTVTLRVLASVQRVLIEVEDQCAGLPEGHVDELFRPFEQRSADRTGMGLGLAFSRWGVEANNGRVSARNLGGRGCIFTVDLPRVAIPAEALAPLP